MQRIVVGVDQSNGAAVALRWALGLARETGAELDVVTAWDVTYGWVEGYVPDLVVWRKDASVAADKLLNEAVASATADGQSGAVKITATSLEGQPAKLLVDRAKDADLLVVGSRGRGGFTGLLLGSVSEQCVHHATVPVVVVPDLH
jgi:nucleotide-binding universal stress UspA family protein